MDRELTEKEYERAKSEWTDRRHNRNVKGRLDKNGDEVYFKLSLREYVRLVETSRFEDKFHPKRVLGRYKDIGHYEKGNCRFISYKENSNEDHYSRKLMREGIDIAEMPLGEYLDGLTVYIRGKIKGE